MMKIGQELAPATVCRPSKNGEMNSTAATAQDPVNGKSLGGPNWTLLAGRAAEPSRALPCKAAE